MLDKDMSKITFKEGLERIYKIVSGSDDVPVLEDSKENNAVPNDDLGPGGFGNQSVKKGLGYKFDSAITAAEGDSESPVSKQLTPVRLDKETSDSFEKFFFPKSPNTFIGLVSSMAQTSERITAFFAFLRYCLKDARHLSSFQDNEELRKHLSERAGRILDNAVTSKSGEELAKEFLKMTATGSNHVIKPSSRLPKGYDIVFMGSPQSLHPTTSSSNTLMSDYRENSIISVTRGTTKSEDTEYQKEYLEAYATEFSQKVVAAGREAVSILLGENGLDPKSAVSRMDKTLPLDFDFNGLNELFFKHTGIILETDFFINVDPNLTSKFNDFMSVNIVRTPNKDAVNLVRSEMRKKLRTDEDGTNNNSPVDTSFLSEYMTEEGMALSQFISIVPSINLPENVARYVSQSPETEQVSLLSLHNWVETWAKRYMRPPNARMQGGTVKRQNMPRFVLPLSKAKQATQARADNGYHIEDGKGDENNVFIGPNGALRYGLPTSRRDEIEENLKNYENDVENWVAKRFAEGMPISETKTVPDTVAAAKGDLSVEDELREDYDKATSHSGNVLHYDWDYNSLITASSTTPSTMVTTNLVGSAKLDSTTLADYLGYDFSDDGEEPIRKSFSDSVVLMNNVKLGKEETSGAVVGNQQDPMKLFSREDNGVGYPLLKFYKFCLLKGRVSDASALVAKAANELGMSEMDERSVLLHSGVIKENMTPYDTFINRPENIDRFLKESIRKVAVHCAGGITFTKMVMEEEGLEYSDAVAEMPNHPHFFISNRSPMSDFGRLYNYLGGMVFKMAMEEILSLDSSQLFYSESPVNVGYRETLDKPNYSELSKTILPMATMFAKYVPNSETIMNEAQIDIEANTPDPSKDADDVRVSGSVEGGQMFPHQVEAHQSLRQRPKFAIMDIAPGGGKTSIGVTDIGSMVTEMNEMGGKKIRPLILCPDGLIRNWSDDLRIFTGEKWNVIPLNSNVVNRWGYEALEELLNSAPVNTIVVAGFNFLGSKKERVAFGTHSVTVSNNLEFLKRFEFDYICIDESHKLKNKSSARHSTIKQLTTASHVRFLRLATGTLISNRVNDIEGQTSLYNAHIFRDGEVSSTEVDKATENKVEVNGEDVPVWEVNTPGRARQKLGRYAAVMTMKKKKWAFMLPSPIESFHPIPLIPDGEDVTQEEREMGELHKQLYDTVLEESLEGLQELVDKAKKRRNASDEDDDDEGGEDEEESPDMDLDENEELGVLSSAELQPYIARIERLVTNPMADPLAPQIFGMAGYQTYHSQKAKYIAKRINAHFEIDKWNKDARYKEYDLLEYNGKNYLARKPKGTGTKRNQLPEDTVGVPPDQNNDVWKPEPQGKVIVFCRYTNSVNGIYNALPEQYQKMAVKFTGEEDDKWSNFESFQNDENTQILVANEMGIAEGHNLQIASRIIRVESPWAPGDLDQASSRIFRPDPQAAKNAIEGGKPGDLYREIIYLDWVLADETMEVSKQARLIAKIFNKTRFDEAENSEYDQILSEHELQEIKMSMESMRSRDSLHDYVEYLEAYRDLNAIQRDEFQEMRETMETTMKDVPVTPSVPGSGKIRTPFVSNQKIDSEGVNPVTMKQFLRNESHANYRENPNELIGMPVMTDQGNGQIAKVQLRYAKRAILDEEGKPVRTNKGQIQKETILDKDGNPVLDEDNPVANVTIKLAGSDETLPSINNMGIVYVPTKLTKEKRKEFLAKNLRTTKSEERKAERQRKEAEREEAKKREQEEEEELVRKAKERRRMQREAEARANAHQEGKKRETNIQEGKPINQGVKKVDEVPPVENAKRVAYNITLHPAYYHGYLTLEMVADGTEPPGLKKYGFKNTGPYAYLLIDRYPRFEKALDYIEEHFKLSQPSANRLGNVMDAFEEGRKGIYRMELAPQSTLPYFFAQRKRTVKDRKEIRPYPIITPNGLQIAVDLKTSPAIRQHIGKSVPGANVKWKEHPGHWLYFAESKQDLRSKVKELKKAGFNIQNAETLSTEITSIKFRAAKRRK